MEISRLQLEHYYIKSLSLRAMDNAAPAAPGGYVSFGQATLSTQVELGVAQLEDGSERHSVQLQINGGPAEGGTFPYLFEIVYLGFFNADQLPDKLRDDLVAVNGTSMLFGIAREQLLNLTSRAEKGAMLLPSMHFAKLAQQRAEGASPPAVTPAAP